MVFAETYRLGQLFQNSFWALPHAGWVFRHDGFVHSMAGRFPRNSEG
jgi:hypothetical protein